MRKYADLSTAQFDSNGPVRERRRDTPTHDRSRRGRSAKRRIVLLCGIAVGALLSALAIWLS